MALWGILNIVFTACWGGNRLLARFVSLFLGRESRLVSTNEGVRNIMSLVTGHLSFLPDIKGGWKCWENSEANMWGGCGTNDGFKKIKRRTINAPLRRENNNSSSLNFSRALHPAISRHG